MNINGYKNICSNNVSNKQQLGKVDVKQLTIQSFNVMNYLLTISDNLITIDNRFLSISDNLNIINNEITASNIDISLLQNYYNQAHDLVSLETAADWYTRYIVFSALKK